MVERQEVEAVLGVCERIRERNLDPLKHSPIIPAPTLAALCRAWLAVDAGLRVYVGRVYDCDVGEYRGEILRTLPESMIGFVRIVPVEGEPEKLP